MSHTQIAVVVGSLRRDSFNRKLASALAKLGPADFSFKQVQIGNLPLYNQDDDANQANDVRQLKAEIARSVHSCKRRPKTIAWVGAKPAPPAGRAAMI